VMQVRVGIPQHGPGDVAFLVACAANVDLDNTDRGVIQPFAEPGRTNDRLFMPVVRVCGNLCLRHIALLCLVRYSSACATSSGRTVVRPEGCGNVGERLSTPWTARSSCAADWSSRGARLERFLAGRLDGCFLSTSS